MIAALSQLFAAGHGVVYIVAGEGDDRARLQNLANRRGLAGHVRFVGVLDQAVLVEAYRMPEFSSSRPPAAKVLASSSWKPCACRTPVLGLAAAVDALSDSELGTMASDAEFAQVLARLLATPKPDPLALAAAVRSRFGYAAFSSQLSNILARILRARAAPSVRAGTPTA